MRVEFYSAVFGAAIFFRMALCAVCMNRKSDHLVRLAMLGLLAAGLGLMLSPFYAEIEVPTEQLLAGALAVYLYADRRTVGPCGQTCNTDVVDVLAWLERHRRVLAGALIAISAIALLAALPARAVEAPPDELVQASRAQLRQLISYTNALVDEVARLKAAGARGGCT